MAMLVYRRVNSQVKDMQFESYYCNLPPRPLLIFGLAQKVWITYKVGPYDRYKWSYGAPLNGRK